MTTATPPRPRISAWSAVSPFGTGRDAFRAGLAAGRGTAAPLPAGPDSPVERACLVPDFDVRTVLGRKGTRSMDRVTGLALLGVRELLAEPGSEDEPDAALVLGTTTGSARSMMQFTRDSLTGAQPFFVDPARFPNTVMNCAAGQCAIWHGLRGPNATIAGGRVAGLFALSYSRRLLAAGRASTVLCGAVEEFSDERSWLEWHVRGAETGSTPDDTPLGEGAVLLRMSLSAPDPLAEVAAVRLGTFTGDDPRAAITAVVGRVLAEAGITAAELSAVVPTGAPGPLGELERAALAEVTGREPEPPLTALIGDTAAAASAFGVAAVLAAAGPGHALVCGVDREGSVGAAVLTLFPR